MDLSRALERWARAPGVVGGRDTRGMTLDEVFGTILAVGARTGVPDRAGSLVATLRSRLAAVATAVADRPGGRSVQTTWQEFRGRRDHVDPIAAVAAP